MKPISKAQIRIIYTLLGQLKLREFKEDLVMDFTKERTNHVSEMTDIEAGGLQIHLKRLADNNSDAEFILMQRMRRKVIAIYREMGFNIYNQQRGKMVADMIRIETSTVEHWGKLLNDFSKEELAKVIGVLENKFLPNYYKHQTNG